MPYKNKRSFNNVPMHRAILKQLDNYRVKKNEAYWKIIKRIMEKEAINESERKVPLEMDPKIISLKSQKKHTFISYGKNLQNDK